MCAVPCCAISFNCASELTFFRSFSRHDAHTQADTPMNLHTESKLFSFLASTEARGFYKCALHKLIDAATQHYVAIKKHLFSQKGKEKGKKLRRNAALLSVSLVCLAVASQTTHAGSSRLPPECSPCARVAPAHRVPAGRRGRCCGSCAASTRTASDCA